MCRLPEREAGIRVRLQMYGESQTGIRPEVGDTTYYDTWTDYRNCAAHSRSRVAAF